MVSMMVGQGSNVYSQGKKVALLIGVGKYAKDTDWADLSSVNDIELMKTTLRQVGFDESNIITLKNEEATHEGILQALNQRLNQMVSKGDIVYVHFSGHGQQGKDENGDELDGLDECIVPYDSPKKYKEGVYEGKRLISDDLLNEILLKLRNKIGSAGQVIVALDACHSGTGIRSGLKARGSTDIMAGSEYLASLKSYKGTESATLNLDKTSQSDVAPVVALYGAAQNQLNYEVKAESGENFGSLSFALAKSLSSLTGNVSFRTLFGRVTALMSGTSPLQQPQAEGSLDVSVFNLSGQETKPSFSLVSLKNNQLAIQGGFFKGLHKGSKIGLFAEGDTKQLIWEGVISKSTAHLSYAQVSDDIFWDNIKNLHCYVIEDSFSTPPLDMKLDLGVHSSLKELVQNKPYIRIVDSEPEMILKEYQSFVTLRTKDGFVLDSFQMASTADMKETENHLSSTIKKYLQGKWMRNFESTSENLDLQFDLIPVSKDLKAVKKGEFEVLQEDADGQKRLPVGSDFKILVSNNGIKPAFFTLLDIQPDNIINILLPSDNYTAEEMRILPDRKMLIPITFKTGYPLGNELFKLIASDKPIDFKSPLYNRKSNSASFLEKIFHLSLTDGFYQTKSGVTGDNKNIHIYSQSYIIVK